jgi:hypothetical protein
VQQIYERVAGLDVHHLPLGQPRLQHPEPGGRRREPVLLEHNTAPRPDRVIEIRVRQHSTPWRVR